MYRIIIFLLLLISTAQADELWYMDNNLGNAGGIPIDFTTRQDNQWIKTLQSIDVYYLRRSITTKLSDAHLKRLADTLNRYNISVALDTPSATWGSCRNSDDINVIKRLQRLGFKIEYIGLQSVLSKPYKGTNSACDIYKSIHTYNGALARVFDVINYFSSISKEFPNIKLGIIDALPAKIHDPLNRYKFLYNELVKRGLKLDFIHLDIPASYPRTQINNITYSSLVNLAKVIQSHNVKFGMFLVSNIGGQSSGIDVTKFKVHELHSLLDSGMRANYWISSGWYPQPQRSVPESSMYTSTGALLEINDVLKMWRIR